MSVGFTGTQFGLTSRQKSTLKHVLEKLREDESKLRHGDCVGADTDANTIARVLGFKTVSHPPINEKKRAFCEVDEILPAKEYLERNQDIVNCSKLLIACPRGAREIMRSGTWATVRRARKVNKDIILIYFDGSIKRESRSE